MSNFSIEPLLWEKNFFNVASCKLILNDSIEDSDLIEINKKIIDFEFITIQNINNRISNNTMLKKIPCYLIDVNVQFVFEKKSSYVEINQEQFICIENLKQEEIKEIENIIRNSFNYSRFFDEKKLPISRYHIYVEWFKNSISDNEKKIIINKNEFGKITSFVIFNTSHVGTIQIELICSIEKGMGTKLINELKRVLYEDSNLTKIIVGTQINNISAQNFYIRNGFLHNHNDSIYHLWKEDIK
ncbi:hypothetical protein ACOXU5_08660 [Vagococcus fluvialis]|uniref:GNAT family N-acetyltransferase n=1 Tax=Vagococcus fluvialis TaxID=2738 RepID=UPI001A8E5568|nr:GNAT family N-acetyltransferase [Vagococcus fluvialis]MBO0442876.1 GNAT family N-acetyltransferase [Vagococcus fluvialis]